MKYCRSCNVYFNNDNVKCTFCNDECTDETSNVNVQNYKEFTQKENIDKKELMYKVVAYIVCLISIIFNVLMYKTTPVIFSVYVCVIALSCYGILKNNLSNNLIYYHLCILSISQLLDMYIFDNPITVIYVIPVVSVTFLLTLLTTKGMFNDAFSCIILDIVLSIIPFILLLEDGMANKIPAYLSLGSGVLATIYVVTNKNTKNEIEKRIHI